MYDVFEEDKWDDALPPEVKVEKRQAQQCGDNDGLSSYTKM
jgi:hypothetical protein